MDVAFEDRYLDRLETDWEFTCGLPNPVVKAFRKRLQMIRAAPDENDLYVLRSVNFERLKGDKSHQYSMRLDDQWRLIIELQTEASNKVVVIISIEDYH
jgi:proteic killer suppression protein